MTDRTLAMEGGRDSLTKLFNRRFLRTVMQKEVRLSQSSGDRFGVVMVDVDHFKSINDRYGHDTGDGVLKQIAEILVSSVRAGDFVFRYGGEEFLLLVGGMTRDFLLMIAEKVRSAVEQHDFRTSLGEPFKVTISLGLALHDGHPDFQRLISAADEALFDAKHEGRNRVQLFKPSSASVNPQIRNGAFADDRPSVDVMPGPSVSFDCP
jgi:diguanylate cyclase